MEEFPIKLPLHAVRDATTRQRLTHLKSQAQLASFRAVGWQEIKVCPYRMFNRAKAVTSVREIVREVKSVCHLQWEHCPALDLGAFFSW